MKTKLIAVSLVLCVLAGSALNAGMLGWATSRTASWEFMQSVGGIRIGNPEKRGGRLVLPIECDVSGLQEITCKPTTMNSGLVVRRMDIRRAKNQLVLRVVTAVAEKGFSPAGPFHASLAGIPTGSYDVYYETAGEPQKHLGNVTIP